jgi:hypothetical protein
VAETDTQNFRCAKPRWTLFGTLAGVRRRAQVLNDFIAWYNREPGARLPQRPPAPTKEG